VSHLRRQEFKTLVDTHFGGSQEMSVETEETPTEERVSVSFVVPEDAAVEAAIAHARAAVEHAAVHLEDMLLATEDAAKLTAELAQDSVMMGVSNDAGDAGSEKEVAAPQKQLVRPRTKSSSGVRHRTVKDAARSSTPRIARRTPQTTIPRDSSRRHPVTTSKRTIVVKTKLPAEVRRAKKSTKSANKNVKKNTNKSARKSAGKRKPRLVALRQKGIRRVIARSHHRR